MAVFQTQIYLFDQGRIFSETYYFVGNSFAEAMDALDKLALSRQGLVGGKVQVGRLRVARVPADRNVMEAGVRAHPVRESGREPWDSIIVDLYAKSPVSGRLYQRAMSIRGLPAGLRDKASPWWDAIRTHLDLLISLGFRMQCYDRDLKAVPVVGAATIADQGGDPAGNPIGGALFPDAQVSLALVTRQPHGIPLADPFTQKHAKVKWFGAVWEHPGGRREKLYVVPLTVLRVLPNVVVVRARLPAAGRLAVPGKIKLASYAYFPLTGTRLKYDPTRKTGGRSKVKPSVYPPFPGVDKLPAELALELQGPPAPPEEPPMPPEDPNPPPFTVRLTTAYDVVKFVEEGYFAGDDGVKYQIRIARVNNYKDTWFIAASGTDLTVDAATGICEDISSSLGGTDEYVIALWEWVQRLIPKGSTVFMAGDSLGGMELQNLLKFLYYGGYKPANLLTFNSPITTYFYFATHTVRFAEQGDLVINAAPAGLALFLLAHPEQTFLPEGDWGDSPVRAHKAIYNDFNLADYDSLGYETAGGPQRTLLLGFVNKLEAKHSPV